MSANPSLFRGSSFFLIGSFPERPVDELCALILRHGGSVSSAIRPDVKYVVASIDSAHIWTNNYKLQFHPELKQQVEFALMHRMRILNVAFIDEAIKNDAIPTLARYYIKEFDDDMEAKFAVSSHVPSNLDPRVQRLVQDLFDQKQIDRSLVEMGLDVRKISLVTQAKIKEGYSLLQTIESNLVPSSGQSKSAHEAELKRLTTQFYNLIPHSGDANTLPLLNSTEALKEKASLLATLTDIEIAQRLIASSGGPETLNMNPIDVNYRKLRTNIVPLEAYRAEYDLISQMIRNTQSTEFKFHVELDEIFEVERQGEAERFAPFKSLPHHRLLWHGSRTANYIGILSQGLRIAPPEAPVTGYFLGKGIYLADMVSVSAQYCRIKKGDATQHAYLLLCDAALGRAYQIAHGKFISKDDLDENGFHSVKCWGTKGPQAGYDVTTPEGLTVSLGKEGSTGVPVSELIHNETVVYDPAQLLIKYMVKLRFSFPRELEVAPSASKSTF